MKKLYLCGAISGCTDSQCKDWRELVKKSLEGKYEFLDPMRRDYRGKEVESVDAIVAGDERDIQDCDIVLAAADIPSWGTGMEIRAARTEYGKPVLAVCAKDSPSPWLVKHTRIFKTLDAAIGCLAFSAISDDDFRKCVEEIRAMTT